MLILDLIIKSAIIGILVAVLGRLIFSQDSNWRLFLWKSFFIFLLVLPLLIVIVPDIKIPLIIQYQPEEPARDSSPKVFRNHEFLPDYHLSNNNRIVKTNTEAGGSNSESTNNQNQLLQPLFLFWLTGFIGVLTWFLFGYMVIHHPANKGQPAKDDGTLKTLNSLRSEMQIDQEVELFISTKVTVPCTSGLLKPFIIVPEKFLSLSESSQRLSLQHELEHILRRDFFWNALVNLCCAVFWFNPFAWICASQYRTFREKSVDEKIVRNGVKAADYAHLLVNVAAQTRTKQSFIMDAVLISKVSSLKDRIISILYSDSECKTCKKSNKLAIFVLLLSATVLLSALTPGDFKIESDKVTKAFQSQIAVFSTSEVEIVYDHISRVDRNFRRSSLAELQNLAEQYPLLPELRLSLLKALLKAGKHDDARIQAATISRLSNGNFRSHLRLASLYSQNKLYKYAFHWLYKAIENDPDEFNEIHDWRSLRGLRNQSKFSTLERARKRRGLEKLRDDYLIKELLAISESTHTPAPAKGFSALLGTIAANAPDHNHREIAIELLGGLGSEEAYSAIENALTREIDPDIIETAFESIQRFPQKTINSRIEGTCKIIDSPWAVVFSAGILARINPEEASTNLLNVLLLKTDHDCHKYAVYTLSKIPVFGIEALKEVAANHPSDSMKSRAERYLKPDHH